MSTAKLRVWCSTMVYSPSPPWRPHCVHRRWRPVRTSSNAAIQSLVMPIPLRLARPPVALNVISLVTSSCGYDRGAHRAPRGACMRGAPGDTARAHDTSTTPPSAARAARCPPVGASRPASTVAPEALPCSGTTSRAGHAGGRARGEQRPHRFSCLVRRCPPTSPLFASWPWSHRNWMLFGSSCYDSTFAES